MVMATRWGFLLCLWPNQVVAGFCKVWEWLVGLHMAGTKCLQQLLHHCCSSWDVEGSIEYRLNTWPLPIFLIGVYADWLRWTWFSFRHACSISLQLNHSLPCALITNVNLLYFWFGCIAAHIFLYICHCFSLNCNVHKCFAWLIYFFWACAGASENYHIW